MATRNPTLNDVQLAKVYYAILTELAKQKHCITYSALVKKAKEENPDLDYVQKAMPTSTGRKLEVIHDFTEERELPDVTSLVINKSSGECGDGFIGDISPEMIRETVFDYDWSEVSTEFDMHLKLAEESTKKVKAKTRMTNDKATEIMSSYYYENKAALPKKITTKRDAIIKMIMNHVSTEEAFAKAAEDL